MLRRYVEKVASFGADEDSDEEMRPRRKTRGALPKLRWQTATSKMPPIVEDDEIESDGPDAVPAKGIIPTKADELAVDEEEDDDDDVDEDEFRVEDILAHRFTRDGMIEYEIKWLGYERKSDRTWEPIENLENAMDLVDEYHSTIGGAPIPPFTSKSKSAKNGKRSASSAFDSPAVQPSAKKRNRKSETDGVTPIKLPAGSWEDSVLRVHTVLEELDTESKLGPGKDGKTLLGLIEWKDGRKTQHPLSALRRKCPQKMLDYYEQHLVFRSATAKDEALADEAAQIDDV